MSNPVNIVITAREPGKLPVLLFSWDLNKDQIVRLVDFANDLSEEDE